MSKYSSLKRKLDNAEVELKINSEKIKENKKQVKKECERIGYKFIRMKLALDDIRRQKMKLLNEKRELRSKIEEVLDEIEEVSF